MLRHVWTSRATLPDGTAKTFEGLATDIVRRQPDGRWLLVLDKPVRHSTHPLIVLAGRPFTQLHATTDKGGTQCRESA